MADRLTDIERQFASHDAAISTLFDAIRQLMAIPDPGSRPIGFTADLDAGPQPGTIA